MIQSITRHNQPQSNLYRFLKQQFFSFLSSLLLALLMRLDKSKQVPIQSVPAKGSIAPDMIFFVWCIRTPYFFPR